MNNNNIVTIIIPAYNVGSHLTNTLESLARQTVSNFIAMIIDDGSTDNTYHTAESFSDKDKRFITFKKENGGVSSARNYGIARVHTPFYTFIDGDDIVDTRYLEILLGVAKESSADIVSCDLQPIKSYDIHLDKAEEDRCNYNTYTNPMATLKFLYNQNIKNTSCARLYRSSTLKHLKFDENLAVGEDMYYTYKAFKESSSIAITDCKLYYYVQRHGSAMKSSFSIKRMDALYAAKMMLAQKDTSQDEALAIEAKIFTEAFSSLVAMKGKDLEHANEKQLLLKEIKLHAKNVATNHLARKAQRIYATTCLVSIGAARNVAYFKKSLTSKGWCI